MLSYALAIAVAISSLVLFLTAFVMSDVHRRDDFLWSGVGLLYALVLWFCARNITGAVLLGQAAATALLISYSWQTLKLRKAIAHPEKATEIANFSILRKVNSLWQRNRPPVSPTTTTTKVKTPITPKVTEQEIVIPDTVPKNTVPETTVKDSDVDLAEETTEGDRPTPPTQTKPADKTTQVPAPATTQQLEASQESNPTVETVAPKPAKVENAIDEKVSLDSPSETQTADTTISKKVPVSTAEPQQSREKLSLETEDAVEKEILQEDGDRPTVARTTESKAAMPTEAEPANATTEPNVEPESKPTPQVEPRSKASEIDSLETVEVAEVLEASNEDRIIDPDFERDNIIEVTTTEINITTEVRKVENESEEDWET